MSNFDDDRRLHELEKRALTGDRLAVIKLVNLCRRIRADVNQAIDQRYRLDGASDSEALRELERRVNSEIADTVMDVIV